jgi:hypothetical protein
MPLHEGRREPASAEQKKARKRELDRLCQQRKRRKDRELVQRLETQLNSLKQRADGDIFYDLILQREKDQAKIDRHIQRAKQIQALLQADLDDLLEDGKRLFPYPISLLSLS